MTRILIDANSLQADQHLKNLRQGQVRSRLTTFLKSVQHQGCVSFAPIDAEEFDNTNLLIIATRLPNRPYCCEEIRGIRDFVYQGGSLLLMSNHSRVPSCPRMGHFTKQDGLLASKFGVGILEACFRTMPKGKLTSIQETGDVIHPILTDSSGSRVVQKIKINNCSAITGDSENGQPILFLDDKMADLGPNNLSPSGQAFAWSIDDYGEGHVVIVADSGFIADDVPGSGPGLIDRAHNESFIRQTVKWLLKRNSV